MTVTYVQGTLALSAFQGADEPAQCRKGPLRRTGKSRTAVQLCVLPEEEPGTYVLRCRKVAVVCLSVLKTAEAVRPETRVSPTQYFSGTVEGAL